MILNKILHSIFILMVLLKNKEKCDMSVSFQIIITIISNSWPENKETLFHFFALRVSVD